MLELISKVITDIRPKCIPKHPRMRRYVLSKDGDKKVAKLST